MVKYMGIPKKELVNKIAECERLGQFDQPVQPSNPNLVAEIKDDYCKKCCIRILYNNQHTEHCLNVLDYAI